MDPGLISAHGIPPDLLPRLLIIPTHPYTAPEIRTIIQTRSRLEFAAPTTPQLTEEATSTAAPKSLAVRSSLSPEALEELTTQGVQVSLRYALQLLAPAGILARARGSENGVISGSDVKEDVAIFWEDGRSEAQIKERESEFIC